MGSIPACAGQPKLGVSCIPIGAVYPRVCGATSPGSAAAWSAAGLSPRVRGNRVHIHRHRSRRGSIPACAGQPAEGRRSPRLSGVYPRVCGATGRACVAREPWRGLSPRVRGNRFSHLVKLLIPGSIPACAGQPRRRDTTACPMSVYPRVCGATCVIAETYSGDIGLSPRVRGNHFTGLTNPANPRSIPACAGQPLLGRMGRR